MLTALWLKDFVQLPQDARLQGCRYKKKIETILTVMNWTKKHETLILKFTVNQKVVEFHTETKCIGSQARTGLWSRWIVLTLRWVRTTRPQFHTWKKMWSNSSTRFCIYDPFAKHAMTLHGVVKTCFIGTDKNIMNKLRTVWFQEAYDFSLQDNLVGILPGWQKANLSESFVLVNPFIEDRSSGF